MTVGLSEKIKNSRGAIWNAVGSLMYGANSVLLLMLVSRKCGVEISGVFGIAFTSAQMLWVVAVFGASNFQMTDFREQYSFSAYSRLKLLTSAATPAVAILVCLCFQFDLMKSSLTVILTLYMVAHSVSELYQNRMFQKNRLDLAGKSRCFRTLFSLICFAVTLELTSDVILSSLLLLAGNIVSIFLFSRNPCRQFLCDTDTGEGSALLLAKTCLPLFVSIFLMNLLIQLPKYAIEVLCTDTDQGYFNMIFMPAQAINLVSAFIFHPLLNDISALYYEKDKSSLLKLLRKQYCLIAAILLFCLAAAWLLGVQVLGFIYKAELSAYRNELMILILGGGVYALCQLLYYVAVIMRKQKQIFLNYGICMAAFILLCPLLVKQIGITGASLSFLGIHILLAAGYLIILRRSLKEI